MERDIYPAMTGVVRTAHLREVLQLRVVGLREHEAEELDGGVQVRLVSVPVAGNVALDGFEGLMACLFQGGRSSRMDRDKQPQRQRYEQKSVGRQRLQRACCMSLAGGIGVQECSVLYEP